MANQVSVTQTTGFGKRIINAIVGVPIGLLLIAVGIGLLYWNEGRFDLSVLAKKAIEVDASQTAPTGSDGQLVAVKGTVASDQVLGDTFLKPGAYLSLDRVVEMYAWVETKETRNQDNTGGSQTTTTTYTYTNEWVETPANSAQFQEPAGHENPAKGLESSSQRVTAAKVGIYSLDPATLDLPAGTPLALSSDNTIPSAGFAPAGDGQHLYKGATIATPAVGDLRISYRTVNSSFNGVVMGKLTGTSVGAFTDAKNHRLHRLFSGNKNDAVSQLHQEYSTMLWIFRLVGFVAIWVGLLMVLGPLTAVSHFLPTLGHITGTVIATIAFPVALLLSVVTIVVGMIAHSPVALAISLAVAVGVSVWFIRGRGRKMGLKTT